MPPIVEITDLCDPRLDPYARLTERQLKQGNAEGRKTPERGIFIAESKTVVTLALDAGTEPLSFLMDESQLHGASRDLAERILAGEWGDVPLYTASDPVLEELTGFSLNRGVLSAMRRPTLRTPEEVCASSRRIAVLEDIADAANVGAVFRGAAALGMDAVLVTARCSDPLLRRSARVSMGTVFQIPWTRIAWPEDGGGMEELRRMGFETAAMTLSPDSVPPDDPRLKKAEKLAVLIGTEGTGLRAETVRRADWAVKIPMFRGVDSLNAAAAAAVAFWELGKRDV